MAAAPTKVFNTYELLEQVLSQLAFRDLLLVQRVSTHFKSVIGRSIDLQQKLFLSPKEGTEGSDHPLKAAVFGTIDNIIPAGLVAEGILQARMKCAVWDNDFKRLYCPMVFSKVPQNAREKSWWSMYATQPPVKQIDLRALNTDSTKEASPFHGNPSTNGPFTYEFGWVLNGEGITFGNMVSKAESLEEKGWEGAVFLLPDKNKAKSSTVSRGWSFVGVSQG